MEEIRCAVDPDKLVKKGRCLYIIKQIPNPEKACSNCLYYQKLRELGFDPIKGLPERILMGFTSYPPDGVIPIEEFSKLRAYITETEVDRWTFLNLMMSERSFKESRNPFEAMRALVISHEAGLYPPIWAIEWLVKALKEYHQSNGTKDLDELLGFRRGKGQDPVFKLICEEERDEALMWDLFKLHKFGGYSVQEAARMVRGKLEKSPGWNKTGWKLTTVTAGTLAKKYSEKWKSIFEKIGDDVIEKMAEKFNREKKAYLRLFPRPSKRK